MHMEFSIFQLELLVSKLIWQVATQLLNMYIEVIPSD